MENGKSKINEKGRFSKNIFLVALRNPLYCGNIFIPPYKEEKGHFVAGQHQPLISEKMFTDVQEIIDGRKRAIKLKRLVTENLPLKAFLSPKGERMLSGSVSKGRNAYYNNYHCSSFSGTRFEGEIAYKRFNKQTKAQNSGKKNTIGELMF